MKVCNSCLPLQMSCVNNLGKGEIVMKNKKKIILSVVAAVVILGVIAGALALYFTRYFTRRSESRDRA